MVITIDVPDGTMEKIKLPGASRARPVGHRVGPSRR